MRVDERKKLLAAAVRRALGGKQVFVLTSFVAVKFKMDGESAFQPGPLCATLCSFCLPCCFRDPWGGWAENDVFRDDWCVFVDEGTKTVVVLGEEAVKVVGRIGDEVQTFDVVDESFRIDVAEPTERDRHRWKTW